MAEESAVGSVDVSAFHERGFTDPFRVCSGNEMREIRERIDAEVLTDENPEATPGKSRRSSTATSIRPSSTTSVVGGKS
ncbi:hypothetical protein [Halorussus caseinilyticus]|uniref:Uncharacterized protein n=1 Tax=Halorussus caseinilyticus TaxID=3034025 RepID=A0ABD5WIW2_9EURY